MVDHRRIGRRAQEEVALGRAMVEWDHVQVEVGLILTCIDYEGC